MELDTAFKAVFVVLVVIVVVVVPDFSLTTAAATVWDADLEGFGDAEVLEVVFETAEVIFLAAVVLDRCDGKLPNEPESSWPTESKNLQSYDTLKQPLGCSKLGHGSLSADRIGI